MDFFCVFIILKSFLSSDNSSDTQATFLVKSVAFECVALLCGLCSCLLTVVHVNLHFTNISGRFLNLFQ